MQGALMNRCYVYAAAAAAARGLDMRDMIWWLLLLLLLLLLPKQPLQHTRPVNPNSQKTFPLLVCGPANHPEKRGRIGRSPRVRIVQEINKTRSALTAQFCDSFGVRLQLLLAVIPHVLVFLTVQAQVNPVTG